MRAPYGSTLIGRSYQNGPAFTGHMEDGGTGLTYMKARYYDPVAMRFLSPEPVYVDLGTGGNFNRYWYANNNPYKFVDPDGRQAGCGTNVKGGSAFGCSSFGSASEAINTGGIRVPDPLGLAGAAGAIAAYAHHQTQAIERKEEQKTHITYTIRNRLNSRIYVGRASGVGTPQEVLNRRMSSHSRVGLEWERAQVESSLGGEAGRLAIRGREQQLIDANGGIGSPNVDKVIRAVSRINPSGPAYHLASDAAFGNIAPLHWKYFAFGKNDRGHEKCTASMIETITV